MPRVTISYRRDDSGVIAGRIFDRLVAYYGADTVFRDIDNIPPGLDFRKHINDALDTTDILLAIVGPRWAGKNDDGRHRIQETTDLVRLEVEAALQKGIPVIPVLVANAMMPEPGDLPDSLQDFAFRNAVKVDGLEDFDNHVGRLIRSMDRLAASSHRPAQAEATQEDVARRRKGDSLSGRGSAPPTASGWRRARQTALVLVGLVFGAALSIVGFLWLRPHNDPPPTIYNSAELGLTVVYPHNLLSLDVTDEKNLKLSLIDGGGHRQVLISRTDLREKTDLKAARQREADDLTRLGYRLDYVAPKYDQNWSNWYVVSGTKLYSTLYIKRWYLTDGVVSIEFTYPTDQAAVFDKIIKPMVDGLNPSPTTPHPAR